MVVFNVLPLNTLVSTAKSPSSNAGINSPPKESNTKTDKINIPATENNTAFGKATTLFNTD